MTSNRRAHSPLLLSVALSTLVAGCAGASFFIEPDGATPTTLFQSSTTFSANAPPVHVVLRTPEDWQAFLSDYPPRSEGVRDLFWWVDYRRHMVVGLALGRRGSSSIRVNIDSIRVEDHRLLVYATEHHTPIRRDWANPAHFVVVARMERPVEFAEIVVKEGRRR